MPQLNDNGKCMIGDPTVRPGEKHPAVDMLHAYENAPKPENMPELTARLRAAGILPEPKPQQSPLAEQWDQMVAEAHERHERAAEMWERLNEMPVQPDDTVTFVIDKDTGGVKGQKLARFSYIPQDVLWELAEHYAKGLAKYPDSEDGKANWQRGYSWRLSVDALFRHLSLWLQGEDADPESGSSHLIAAIWHLFALRWFQLHGKGKDFRWVNPSVS
jgi:hypothetical protein